MEKIQFLKVSIGAGFFTYSIFYWCLGRPKLFIKCVKFTVLCTLVWNVGQKFWDTTPEILAAQKHQNFGEILVSFAVWSQIWSQYLQNTTRYFQLENGIATYNVCLQILTEPDVLWSTIDKKIGPHYWLTKQMAIMLDIATHSGFCFYFYFCLCYL